MRPIVASLSVCSLLLLNPEAALSQDEVHHLDPATRKEVTTSGAIQEESAAGVRVRPGAGAVRAIPAQHVVQIIHQTSVPRLVYRIPFGAEEAAAKATVPGEREKLLRTALSGYQELLPKLSAVLSLTTLIVPVSMGMRFTAVCVEWLLPVPA